MVKEICILAGKYKRYGYRRITVLLKKSGWDINHKRVERIWQKLGFNAVKRKQKRRRQFHNNGSVRRYSATHKNHVWSYDFIFDRTSDGKTLKILSVLDEFTRECLALKVSRKLKSTDIIDVLNDLFLIHGIPEYTRSDNGSEFIAAAIRKWLKHLKIKPLYIEPGSPWENGYIESFHGSFRDELLSQEQFDSIYEAEVLIEQWRVEYNHIRPHSSLKYVTPTEYRNSMSKKETEIYSGKSCVATPLRPCQNIDNIVYS